MKKYLLLLGSFCFSVICLAQTDNIQGTVKSEPGYKVAVFMTPFAQASASSGNNFITFNITTSFEKGGFTNPPTPVLTHQMGGAVTITPGIGTPSLEGTRYVYNYILSGTIPNFTWNAGVELPIMKLDFSADPNFTDNFPWLQHNPTTGGPNFTSVFYIEMNGDDWTRYTDMFYGGAEGSSGGYDYVEALAPLPVTLIAFNAEKYNERHSFLTWSTASEINSSHFLVQRSVDKISWGTIGKLDAAGNSQIIRNYEFIDENVYNGHDARLSVYYRLEMVDIDGQRKISPIKNIIFGNSLSSGREITVYPNPSSEGLQIEWDASRVDQPTQIEFFDVKGKLVYTKQVSDNTNQEYIDFGHTSIQPGLYILRILSGTEAIEHRQIVVTQR